MLHPVLPTSSEAQSQKNILPCLSDALQLIILPGVAPHINNVRGVLDVAAEQPYYYTRGVVSLPLNMAAS